MLKIGTRSSPLAMKQAEMVRDEISKKCSIKIDNIKIIPFLTKGDKILDRNLSEIGGKGLFTEEIERAILDNEIDLAVHSMKDMPTSLNKGLIISATLRRENASDMLIGTESIDKLAEGAVFGTSSTRRAAILHSIRPDLQIIPFRGNIQTRIEKLKNAVASATILATAGLNRMGLSTILNMAPLDTDIFVPAVGQGALAIETSVKNSFAIEISKQINHKEAYNMVQLERCFLNIIDGSCKIPVAGFCNLTESDGKKMVKLRFLAANERNEIHKIIQVTTYENSMQETLLAGHELKKFINQNK